MTMTPEQQVQLEYEVEFGANAESANNLYLKDFIEVRREQMQTAFNNCEPNAEELMKLKYMSMAIEDLATAVQSDIDTGKMASSSLGYENEFKE